ncbi:MAG: CoA transferase [Thermoplasmata archaeon]|nr:CoA transferase [Thermoplasmata archaeon]
MNLGHYRERVALAPMSTVAPRISVVPPFGPLAGVRVIDSGRLVAGPWAATYLGEFGAEVIHVEGPPFAFPYADPSRTLVPRLPEGAPEDGGVSESWVQYARNKLSLGLDLRTPDGRAVFLDLLARSDIWVESSRPGTYDRLGLSDAVAWASNPRLTIVHVSGYGQTGRPERLQLPSYDLTAQAYSGFLSLQGRPDPDPPMRAGTALNDTVTGLAAAAGGLMGYVSAQRTGVGQAVDVAQYEVFFSLLENLALDYFARGVVRGRHGTGHARLYPYDVHRASDGWVVVAAPTQESWTKLARLMGLNDPAWMTDAARREARPAIDPRIAAFCAGRTVSELEEQGRSNDVAISGVFDMARIARDPHYAARGMFVEWEDPVAGRVRGAAAAPRFSHTPAEVWRGAPWLGQDNRAVLTQILGYPTERVVALERSGVVGASPPLPRVESRAPYFVRAGL